MTFGVIWITNYKKRDGPTKKTCLSVVLISSITHGHNPHPLIGNSLAATIGKQRVGRRRKNVLEIILTKYTLSQLIKVTADDITPGRAGHLPHSSDDLYRGTLIARELEDQSIKIVT